MAHILARLTYPSVCRWFVVFVLWAGCSSDEVPDHEDAARPTDAGETEDASRSDAGLPTSLPYDRRQSFYSSEDRSTRGAGASIDFLDGGDFVISGLQMGNFLTGDDAMPTPLDGWSALTARFSPDLESRWVTVRASNVPVPTTPTAETQVTIGSRTFVFERYASRGIVRLDANGEMDASWSPVEPAEDPPSTISRFARDGDTLVVQANFRTPRTIAGDMVEGVQLVWLDQDLLPLQAITPTVAGQLYSDPSGGVAVVARSMDDDLIRLTPYDRTGPGTAVDLVPAPDGSGRSVTMLEMTTDRIVFAGRFAEGQHSADPRSPSEVANDSVDVFVTVLDRSGGLVFADSFGGSDLFSTDRPIALAVDPASNRVALVVDLPRPPADPFDGIDVETGGLATDLYTLVFLPDGTLSRVFRVGGLGQSPDSVGDAAFSNGALWTAISEWQGGGGSNIHHGLTVRRSPL